MLFSPPCVEIRGAVLLVPRGTKRAFFYVSFVVILSEIKRKCKKSKKSLQKICIYQKIVVLLHRHSK